MPNTPIESRVTRVETRVDGLQSNVTRLEASLATAVASLDQKLTWLIGIVFAILLAIIGSGLLA